MCHCPFAQGGLVVGRKAVCRAHMNGCKGGQGTYKMANLRGLTMKMGVNISPMQVANNAKAAIKRPPKTSNRSHLLTASVGQQRSALSIVELGSAEVLHAKHVCAGTPFSHIDHRV
jgi:hypothetical protein